MIDKMIWDAKYTERSYDDNGYLHVAMTPISKATVNPYKGSELQGLTETKLDPDRIYFGYRAPEELAKGAKTFNGLFLLDEHHEIDAMSIPKQYIIGTVGTDAVFKDGYLYNSLVIADQDAINCVEDKSKWEISSAYKFVPVFKEGEVETAGGDKIHYDFVMTDIRGNHVALVPEGRAGHDVRVADSKGELNKMEKENVRCASMLECQLRENADKFKLAEVENIITTKNLDLKVLNTIKAGSDVVAVIVGNEGHTYSIAYDEKGEIKVSELLSDASALTVSNAYMKGQMEACEFQAKEHEMEQMAHEMAHHIAEKEKCDNTVVVVEKPMTVEPVVGSVDLVAPPVAPALSVEELSSVVADEGAEVNMELNRKELAKVDELEQKDDGYEEKSFYEIKDRFSDARFNSYDDFVQEVGKFNVIPGKVTVVESGISYSVKCTKGNKVFTIEFKQQPNCIEISQVYDDEQISTKELDVKVAEEKQELKSEEPPMLNIATDKKVSRRKPRRIAKDSGKDNEKLKSALLEKKPKTGKIAKAAGIGSKKLDVKNNKNQEVNVEDGGPGSGRKKGSKNRTLSGLRRDYNNASNVAEKAFHQGKTKFEQAKGFRNTARSARTKISNLTENSSARSGEKNSAGYYPAIPNRKICSVDSKKKVKGCVGDANMEEAMQINNVFGLLMEVLGDNFNHQGTMNPLDGTIARRPDNHV